MDIALGLQVSADLTHVGDVPLVEMKSRLRVRLVTEHEFAAGSFTATWLIKTGYLRTPRRVIGV